MKEYTKQVAETILSQLKYGRERVIKVMSWGARQWTCGETAEGNSFLAFRVSGFVFKGIVKVILWGDDTYTVQLIKNEKGAEVIKHEQKGVYNEDLTDIIDGLVEKKGTQEEYEKKVRSATYNL